MLSILYFATMTYAVLVCFDMEAGNKDLSGGDDEINEETACNICTRTARDGKWISPKRCKKNIKNNIYDCIESAHMHRIDNVDFYVQTDCLDGMWLDRLLVKNTWWQGTRGPKWKYWGKNNDFGWCLSKDMSDHNVFRAKTNGKCYGTLRFRPDGSAWGWYGNSQQPNLGRRLSIERRLAGDLLDLTSDGDDLFDAKSGELVGFTEGEELAVPMEHAPVSASMREQDFEVEEGPADGRF